MSKDALGLLITALDGHDSSSAAAVVDKALSNGARPAELMDDLIGPVQRWVGEQWETGRWTVQDEHRATNTIAHIIEAMRARAKPPKRQRVMVASAEGEWHTLPSLMVACALELAGFEIRVFEAPIPSGQILSAIHEFGPSCVVISCVMAANLPGLRRTAVVVRDAGVPVVVGGSLVNAQRHPHVGGNQAAGTIQTAASAVESAGTLSGPVPPLRHGSAAGYDWMEWSRDAIAGRLGGQFGALSQESKTDVLWMLKSLHATLLCDEPSILADHIAWQRRRTKVRGYGDTEVLIEILRRATAEGPTGISGTMDQAILLTE